MAILIKDRFDIPQDVKDQVIAPGYSDMEIGYKKLDDDGNYYVCTYARFPHAKGEMINWWYSEWLHDADSYKLWSKDHVSFYWNEAKRPGTVVGATHISSEYLGDEIVEMAISFYDPNDIFDTSKFEENNISLALVQENRNPAGEIINVFVHIVRDTYFGCEIRNRFFMPNSTEQDCKDLIAHNVGEMGNLGEFLANLYKRENQ